MVEQKLAIGGRLLRFRLLSLEVLLYVVLLVVHFLLRRLTVHHEGLLLRAPFHGQEVALHRYLLLLLHVSLVMTDGQMALVVLPLLFALL